MKHPRATKQPQAGFMLIEVLISVLIFSVGVLALVGLQVSMTHAQTEAKVRADAAYLASELVALMWSDAANLAGYGSSCNSQCTVWKAKVGRTLPSSTTTVTTDVTTGNVSITLTWKLPSGSQHQYVTQTTVRTQT